MNLSQTLDFWHNFGFPRMPRKFSANASDTRCHVSRESGEIAKIAKSTTGRRAPKSKKGLAMKEGIHPNYRDVVFHDTAANEKWITRSTLSTNRTIKMDDGKEYPLVVLEISSASHPFYTGKQQRILDTAGRVERFNKKYAKKAA
jgi:large subunit ribosomal protein L31